MYTTFFRSFYLVFIGLFVMLFFGTAVIVVRAAQFGDYRATILGIGVGALIAMLIEKAARYMRG